MRADRTNSYFETVRAEAGLSTLSTKVHFAVPRIPAPPLLPPGAPAPQTPPPPATTPDARSFFVGFVYNLRELPEQPMAVRAADPRVGYFTDSYTDLSNDLRANPRVHNLKRWRLEKKDPQAALSEPVKPITYWMDRNIPQRYRASVQSRHPGMEQGLRAHRLQGRDRRAPAARRRHVRQHGRRPRVDPLVRRRRCGLRDRPEPLRPAHRRDPRRRHRHERRLRPQLAPPGA